MFKSVLALLFVIIHLSIFQSARAQDVAFDDIVKALPEASFRTLPATLDKAATLDDERVATLFARLLEGDVYFHPKTQQVMYATKTQGERAWIDTLTEKNIVESSGVRLRKVRVNNRVRSHIRQLLAQRNLSHRDDTVRLQASESLLADVDSISTKVILSRLEQEENADIIEVLTAITALKRLKNDDVTEQLGALETLRGSLYPEVRALTSGYKLPLKVSSAPNCSVTSSFLSRLSAVMAVNTSIISAFSSCSNLDKITLVDIESTSADVDSISTKVILSRLEQEENADIIEVLTAITALKRLKNDDVTEQLGALETLRGSLYPEVRALTSGYKLPLKVSSAPNCSVTSSFLSRLSAVMAVNTSIISAFSSCSNLDKITLVDIESTSAKRLSDACKRTVSSRWLKLRWAKS